MAGLNERFILAEDQALKAKLSGLQVTYPTAKNVGVWFRWPNKELREVERPFITIDLIDVVKASHREHAGGPFELEYRPYGYTDRVLDTAAGAVATDWPVPYDLIYGITTWASDPRHDRQLMAKLLGDLNLIPHRLGLLYIPDDQTYRRLDTLDIRDHTGLDSNNDTEFRRTFTIRVESELFTAFVEEVLRPARLTLTLSDMNSDLREEVTTTLEQYSTDI